MAYVQGNRVSWRRQVQAYLNDLNNRSSVDRSAIGDAVNDIQPEDERIVIEETDGVVVIGLGDHPTHKNYVDDGEVAIIRDEHQYLVFQEFVFNGGELVIEGELILLGDDAENLPTEFFETIVMESDGTKGIQIGDEAAYDHGWRDITAPIELRGTGANDPVFTRNLGGGPFAAYNFAVGDEAWFYFHIPHDIVVPPGGATVHIHVHWKHDTTDVTNTVKWEWTYSHAKGFGQEAMNMTGTTVYAEQASAGQWYPMVTESAGLTISNLTEPDGILEVYMRRVTNGGTDLTNVYVTTCDVHYQSHNLATKNKAPNFYT